MHVHVLCTLFCKVWLYSQINIIYYKSNYVGRWISLRTLRLIKIQELQGACGNTVIYKYFNIIIRNEIMYEITSIGNLRIISFFTYR